MTLESPKERLTADDRRGSECPARTEEEAGETAHAKDVRKSSTGALKQMAAATHALVFQGSLRTD